MLQVARLSPNILGESGDLIRQFLKSQHLPDGGFADRGGNSDLYFTVFGLGGFLPLRDHPPVFAARASPPPFGGGGGLGLVYLVSLPPRWGTVAPHFIAAP